MKKYPNLYPLFCFFSRFYFKARFKMVVKGKENIPEQGVPTVLCSNHISMHDPVFIGINIKRQPRFMGKKELFSTKIGNFIFNSIGAFPVDRSATMDMKSFKTAVKLLKDGNMVAIFAEGTRVKDGEKVEPKAGVSMLAIKGDAVVIPVAISGTYKFRKTITVEYGEPMDLSEYREGKITSKRMEEMTAVIMSRVEEMKIQNG